MDQGGGQGKAPPQAGAPKEEDPEKKQKREEKAREKELKKEKAAAKAALKAAEAAKKDQPSKKAEAKAKKAAAAAAPAQDDAADCENPVTPAGEKKRLAPKMAKEYNPKNVESGWYEWWEKRKFFSPDVTSNQPHFSIVVPPPNVTGSLHLGHALTAAVEDCVTRWRRMSGFNTCWVPGVDHAGIATQIVVEKKLMRERGITRHDLGRDKFLEEVWKWKNEYGSTICKQQRRLGASLDWTRECFTMDENLSRAVTEAFVRFYKDGLIYRDMRLVNWDCLLRTAISDIEVDNIPLMGKTLLSVPGYDEKVEFGVITSFAYPIFNEDPAAEKEEIVVATTRPETMLGDTAVAVHPEDARYKHLHGRFALHPFNGRKIPIVCDAVLVDMAFGTGAVKITPAHDPNDFQTGKRHSLEFINIFTDDGLINSNGGERFQGMKRFEARVAVVKGLEEMGLYRGVADNPMSLPVCSRSSEVIEPMLKPQWYVNCNDMAREACEAVRDGRLEFVPKQFEDVWFRWLENIRDWCISRQLWWGHRIPAWYATLSTDDNKDLGAINDHWIVAHNKEEAEALAKEKYKGQEFKLEQDPDVLDTWFSSGLFPFSVFGWPENTVDMAKFYPTSLLETGHDIIFFWVARMVMMGMRLTGQVPFKQVLLHAMVRDAHGRKMSKSLGNVIDPLEVIEGVSLAALHKKLESGNLDPKEVEKAKKGQSTDFPDGIPECGADALRFSLLNYTAQSVNINLDIQRVVGYRKWCNKLWNVINFAMLNLGDSFVPSPSLNATALPFECRWILNALNSAVSKTVSAMELYHMSDATTAVYAWWLYELCDVFVELMKPVMAGNDADPVAAAAKSATRNTLWTCLDTGLRLLHPFMPFVTEELWQRLPRPAGESNRTETIMLAEYPKAVDSWADEGVEKDMAQVESVVRALRAVRDAYNLQKQLRPQAFVVCRTEAAVKTMETGRSAIATLVKLSDVTVLREKEQPPLGCVVSIVDESVSAYLLLRGVVDASAEIEKLHKEKDKIAKLQEALRKKMAVPGYAEKVPASVREENLAKDSEYLTKITSIEEAMANFQKLLSLDEKPDTATVAGAKPGTAVLEHPFECRCMTPCR